MRTFFRRNSMDDKLAQIDEGMVVYDSQSQRVGVVEFVKFTDEDPMTPGAETSTAYEVNEPHSFMDDMIDAFDDEDDLDGTLHNRLVREGYVRIDGGFLAPDRIVLLDQIADVSQEAVHLTVRLDDLILL